MLSRPAEYNMWSTPLEATQPKSTQVLALTPEERKVLQELLHETANSVLVKGYKKRQVKNILEKLISL